MRSAMLSAWARVEFVVEEGAFGKFARLHPRAQLEAAREQHVHHDRGRRAPCNSITSSPVKLAGAGEAEQDVYTIGCPSPPRKSV